LAKPTTDSFANFKIYVESADSPGVFVAPCGFVNKSLTLTSASSTSILPDCEDPEAPAWEAAAVTALSAAVNGSGVMAEESYETWRAWWASGAAKTIRVEKSLGYWEGSAIVNELGESVALGSEGNRIQLAVSLRNDGEWAWTPAA
jgi:hypothetical protein